MKLASMALALVFLVSCKKSQVINTDSSVESVNASSKISVPGQDLLAAIEKIQKLKPARVQVLRGNIICHATARPVPPYGSIFQCTIAVDGKKQNVAHAEFIIDALNTAKPATRPNTTWSGSYEVKVVAGDVPPYESDIMATITLK